MNKHINFLVELFNKNKIPIILLKGAGENYLKKSGFIQTSDIDILIKRKDIKKVDKVMINEGYKRDLFMSNYYSKFHFHYVYKNPKYNKIIEVHWGLIDKCFKFNFDEDIIWGKRIKKVGENVFILEKEFEAIYLILSYFREYGRHFIKDGFRIKHFISSDFDIDKFYSYVHFHRTDDFVKHFFKLCNNNLFNKPHYSSFKTRSLYRKLILQLFFPKPNLKQKGWNVKHFLFLFLLYPNPKYLIYYFRKGLHYLSVGKHNSIQTKK
jgi:hypothetical protein